MTKIIPIVSGASHLVGKESKKYGFNNIHSIGLWQHFVSDGWLIPTESGQMAVIAGVPRLAGFFCHLIGAASLLVFADTTADATLPPIEPDQRIERLEAFFRSYGCPEPHYTGDYISVADRHALDYRLLPAISVRESTCGVHALNNNYWGWNSAQSGFRSVTAGIEFVASRLANGFFYRNKTLHQKLRAYNPRRQYTPEILSLMQQIEALPPLE